MAGTTGKIRGILIKYYNFNTYTHEWTFTEKREIAALAEDAMVRAHEWVKGDCKGNRRVTFQRIDF